MFKHKEEIKRILRALSEQLDAEGVINVEMVVCGGAALSILGYVQRTTKDIDVVAFVDKSKDGLTFLTKADPLRPEIIEAARKVQRDFNLPENWLNAGPASVMDFGLPEGLMDRVETRTYGKSLIIHFLSRYDQIHLKLHAAVDQSGGRHYDDLMALEPTVQELEDAARWSMTHDSSEGYRGVLKDFLEKIGYKDVAGKL
ncbi:MAG: nucleotidyl transferase AbiEii/AbiGii toxin family protein [Candidatus Omnitrophica bacterium]|nr:nucleotidyl transferase AbiEii/AbiGii toxin family protein [Candidatus Omnitrophota bacterium]MBU4457190.1 nucleotidyl transferase AbiEii/AbiGii toxin family protein [Candidatus Omnitrophota bacterium]